MFLRGTNKSMETRGDFTHRPGWTSKNKSNLDRIAVETTGGGTAFADFMTLFSFGKKF